jgi:hypothetical protein
LRSTVRQVLERRPLPVAIGAVFFVQIYFFQWHPGYPNPNEVIRIYLTRAIVEHGTFRVDELVKRFGAPEDMAHYKGHFYCDKAPGVSIAGIVPFAVARAFGDLDMKTARHLLWLSTIAFPSVLLLLALWRFFGRFGLGEAERSLLLFAFGLGSLHYTFSALLFSHALSGILSLGSFLAVASFKRGHGSLRILAFGGFLAGYAAITEYPVAIPLLFVFLYLCIGPSWRRAWVFCGASAFPIAFWLVYNQVCFDSPLTLGYQHESQQIYAHIRTSGFFGLKEPAWDAFSGSFFGTARGLFFYSPWLLLALPGVYLVLRRRGWRGEGLVALGVLAGYAFFVSLLIDWRQGGMVGQRHFTPLVGFLLVPVAEVLRRAAERPSVPLQALLRASVIVGIVLTVGVTVPWPFVSPAYSNAWPELALPMWRELTLPPSLLEGVGFSLPFSTGVFVVTMAACLLYIAAGPPAWEWPRRVVHGSLAVTLAALGLFAAERAGFDPDRQDRNVQDRVGITKLVDYLQRRPAAREERELLAAAQSGTLTPERRVRLVQLLSQRGEFSAALRHAAPRLSGGRPP